MFLDISKAFDRLWHEGRIYKINCMGVKGNLPALIESFLFERQQSVVLIGQESEWLTIKAGVSHRSVLGSLFIYIYIYILYIKLFADVSSMFSVVVTLSISHKS